jgi:succinate dehydrogenase/fumarate reductase-like Fe-S protein
VFFRKQGLLEFRAAYAGDQLLLVSIEDRQVLRACSTCIACGRCNRGERARIAASRGEYSGPMTLVLASARNTGDAQAAARAWAHVPDEVLERQERLCPTSVPLRALKRLLTTKAQELETLISKLRGTP